MINLISTAVKQYVAVTDLDCHTDVRLWTRRRPGWTVLAADRASTSAIVTGALDRRRRRHLVATPTTSRFISDDNWHRRVINTTRYDAARVAHHIGSRYCRAEIYDGRVTCCPLVSHAEYADGSYKISIQNFMIQFCYSLWSNRQPFVYLCVKHVTFMPFGSVMWRHSSIRRCFRWLTPVIRLR